MSSTGMAWAGDDDFLGMVPVPKGNRRNLKCLRLSMRSKRMRGGRGRGFLGRLKSRIMNKQHMGSSIDDFMKEEGIFEEVQAQAMKEVATWKSEVSITRRDMAENEAELNEPTLNKQSRPVTGLTVGFARARFAADD